MHDLKGDPWLDPKAELPLEESAVDVQFRHPMQEDFMIFKQKKLRGLVAAIALFKQASETTAVPVQHNTMQTTKVICCDPWVSFVLTVLTILDIVCYMYEHGRQLTLLYGHKFSNICKVYVLVCSRTHFVKIKVASLGCSPNLFKVNKNWAIDKIALQ